MLFLAPKGSPLAELIHTADTGETNEGILAKVAITLHTWSEP